MSSAVRSPDPSGVYFVSVAEAGRRLGISRSNTYKLIASGGLRTVKYGSRSLVPTDAVAEAAERFDPRNS
jgi:excisionase family DNA binding protein